MVFDATITLGNILTIAGILGGGLSFMWAMKGELKLLTMQIKIQSKTLEAHSARLEKVEAVLVSQATLETRMNMLDRRLDELRHGVGFIRGSVNRSSIDGEYP